MNKFVVSLVIASVLASSAPASATASHRLGDPNHGQIREVIERVQQMDDTTLEKAKRRLMAALGKADHSKEAREQLSKMSAEEKQDLSDRLGAQSEAELVELFARDLDGRREDVLRKLSKISGRELVNRLVNVVQLYPTTLFITAIILVLFTGPFFVITAPLLFPYVAAALLVSELYDYLAEILR